MIWKENTIQYIILHQTCFGWKETLEHTSLCRAGSVYPWQYVFYHSAPMSGHPRKTTPATDTLIRCEVVKTPWMTDTTLKEGTYEVELEKHMLSWAVQQSLLHTDSYGSMSPCSQCVLRAKPMCTTCKVRFHVFSFPTIVSLYISCHWKQLILEKYSKIIINKCYVSEAGMG